MKVTLKQAEAIIAGYSTAILRNDNTVKTALCCINKRYFTISIVYTQKAVVFTDPPTSKKIVKFYA